MRRSSAALGAVLMLALVVLLPAVAWAHTTVGEGATEVEVGWGDEPAFAGVLNSVQVRLSRDGEPVVQLAGDLKVTVSHGADSVTLPLAPYGTPGEYRAWLVPAQAGDYTFRLVGKAGDESIDQTIRSGPNTFNQVEEVTVIGAGDIATSAPDSGAGGGGSSGTEPAGGSDGDVPVGAEPATDAPLVADTAVEQEASSESSGGSSTLTVVLAMIGAILGVFGFGMGALALSRSRSRQAG